MIRLLPYILLLPCMSALAQEWTLSRQFVFEKVAEKGAQAFLEDRFGFIWIGSSQLYRYDGSSVRPYPMRQDDSTVHKAGAVQALLEDSRGRIWVGANKSLYLYEREKDLFFDCFEAHPASKKRKGGITAILEDAQGRIWAGDERGLFLLDTAPHGQIRYVEGLDLGLKYQEQTGVKALIEDRHGQVFAATNRGLWLICPDLTAEQYLPEKIGNAYGSFYVMDLAHAGQDSLWLATLEGLWLFDVVAKTFRNVELPGVVEQDLRTVLPADSQTLWIGSKNKGLFLLKNGTVRHFPSHPDNPYFLGNPEIRVLMYDRFGNLWIGSRLKIERINLKEQQLPFYQIDPGPNRRNNFTFRLMQDSLGGFWFRYIDLGLGYAPGLDREVEIILDPPPNTPAEEIKNFCTDADGNVWVTTLTSGLYVFPKGKKQYQHIDLGDFMRMSKSLNIIADRKNDRFIWFTSQFGLCRIDRFTRQFEIFEPKKDLPYMETNAVSHLVQTDDGHIWCNVRHKDDPVIVRFINGHFEASPNLPNHPSSIGLEHINHMKAVPGNKIWLGIDNDGAVIIDATKMEFTRYTPAMGFPIKTTESITPDLEGNIWFSGDHKICKYDGNGFQCVKAILGIEKFIYHSAALGKDGRISFGGTNGMYSFYPGEIDFSQDTSLPVVCLSDFKVFNKKRHLGTAIELVRTIDLDFHENIISFEFSALHFMRTDDIRYRHKLEGFQEEWAETDSEERQAVYTNLSPGSYIFRVQATRGDDRWSGEKEELRILLTVLPPWYRTKLAWTLYILFSVGLLLGIRKYEMRRQTIRLEAERLKELDQAKTQLYTNITHEFRTPLTIILGMAEQMKNDPKSWYNEGIRLIRRNGKQLLDLVNQLLDLSKLESGHMPLHLVKGDVITYLQYLIESFHSYADSKDIRLHFITKLTALEMDYDPEKLRQVMSNLLSNAVKFTPAGGDVYVESEIFNFKFLILNGEEVKPLQVIVRDTGMGIAEEHLAHIFDRFYQADASSTRRGEGTGIGLALTKELIRVMGGTIEVESIVDKGTAFTILLPITQGDSKAPPEQEHAIPPSLEETLVFAPQIQQAPPGSQGELPLVLLVEDNADVLTYLSSFLSNDYQIATAIDGREGIGKALELIPDLIVSDVMMPEVDGYELCQTLKTDERTSHIPIILLTAKSDQRARLEGLSQGADAYLAKPFQQEELLVRMENLIALRRKLQERFQQHGQLRQILKAPVQTPDEVFIQKVFQLIEDNLGDEDFGMPQLCKALRLSRSHLFRKIKALTGKSATHLIRSMRLEKGKELLETTHLTVSEVCFAVGFNSPNYFSRAFKEEFGVGPSEVRK